MDRLSARRFGLAVLCGLAAFALNWQFGSEVSPLLLGRVVTLPVAILFGPSLGAVSAMLGGVALGPSTPQALTLLGFAVLEAVLIGVFAKRGKSALIIGAFVWSVGALLLLIVLRLRVVQSIR